VARIARQTGSGRALRFFAADVKYVNLDNLLMYIVSSAFKKYS
jgi:hypothetical protein